MMNLPNKQILVTGGSGFLGNYVVKKLLEKGIPKEQISVPNRYNCDLTDGNNCHRIVKGKDVVIHLAGNGGGIGYNRKYPGSIFYDNTMMGIQLMEAARKEGVEKYVTIGTVCSYPKFAPIPMKEEDIWSGYPEETNASYGLSKKILLVQGNAYRQQYGFNSIHLLLVNLYGPKDNFDPEQSHVIAAMIKKFYDASNSGQDVALWGTGKVSREFLYVEDAAEGIISATEQYNKPDPVNLGNDSEITIKKLAEIISNVIGYKGKIIWDSSKPDGQPRRRLDINRAKKEFGWSPQVDIISGLKKTIDWYRQNIIDTKGVTK
jgi:GDP-L-fucose synthase|tara:strand:- start:2212 stop:3168 length:957 start_codon:yes stop_codon:yes gene_type:complete